MLGPEDQLRKPGSCGRAVLNVETRVVDDAMHDVAPGEVGEIVHRSPHLMLGYFHDDERTRAAFEGGWFHSGDLATIDDEGYITVVDRKKDMIKTGGENVASREVEEAIYRLPAVSEVAVIGVPHPRWVEAVVAVVVPKPGQACTEQDGAGALRSSTWPASRRPKARGARRRRCPRTRAASCSSANCARRTRRYLADASFQRPGTRLPAVGQVGLDALASLAAALAWRREPRRFHAAPRQAQQLVDQPVPPACLCARFLGLVLFGHPVCSLPQSRQLSLGAGGGRIKATAATPVTG